MFKQHGLLDPILGIDTKVFIDPQRLMLTQVPEFTNSRAALEDYLTGTLRLISKSQQPGDRFWREAVVRLTKSEIKGVSIGFGQDTDNGNGIGRKLAVQLVTAAAFIHKAGVEDPAMFELLGLFEENFGPDRLSDLTISILRGEFLAFTQRVAAEAELKHCRAFNFRGADYRIPFRGPTPVTLLPKDLLRPLPVALQQEEIDDATHINLDLRRYWNEIVRAAWEERRQRPNKGEIRTMFEQRPDFLDTLIKVYRENKSGPYDFDSDPLGLIKWASLAEFFSRRFPLRLGKNPTNLNTLVTTVGEIVSQYKKNIEQNGLNKHLYDETGDPRHEEYAQLLFFAIADAYCRANDLDLSPESDAGRGPVDFKISRGSIKVVVELKLSRNSKLIRGYEKQLEIYKQSEAAGHGFYVVLRIHERESQALKELRTRVARDKKNGLPVSDLVIIDGQIGPSASKA